MFRLDVCECGRSRSTVTARKTHRGVYVQLVERVRFCYVKWLGLR